MDCWHCHTELNWNGDFDYEDYALEGEGIVSTLSCPKCDAHVEVYLSLSKFFDINKAKLLKNEGE